jgi:hypothetical protein
MTFEMVAPAWMHEQVTAEQYATWSEEQCACIEIVDGMVQVSRSASKRHNRLARLLANALDVAAGPDWNADTDFDVRLQNVPLNNRRPDVTVYQAETIDVTPTRACASCGRGGLCRVGDGRLRQPVRPQHHPQRRPGPRPRYIDELMPAILNGTVNPGKVFDRTVTLDEVPAAYQAMDDREALKVLIAL